MQGMGPGGDVSYTPLPIHELLVSFSRLGGLTTNQNSSLSNSAFAFNVHTEKRNTNSLLRSILFQNKNVLPVP